MKKYLLFYDVINSMHYHRHEFDLDYDDFSACMEKVNKLKTDEWRMYHTSEEGKLDFTIPLDMLADDINESEFNADNYWCVVINKKD